MTQKKLSELAGVSSAVRRFAPNGWIDAKGKLALTIKVDGARHGLSIKTACMIDDFYADFLDAAREALSEDFAAAVRAEHLAKQSAPASSAPAKTGGGLSSVLAGRKDVS